MCDFINRLFPNGGLLEFSVYGFILALLVIMIGSFFTEKGKDIGVVILILVFVIDLLIITTCILLTIYEASKI